MPFKAKLTENEYCDNAAILADFIDAVKKSLEKSKIRFSNERYTQVFYFLSQYMTTESIILSKHLSTKDTKDLHYIIRSMLTIAQRSPENFTLELNNWKNHLRLRIAGERSLVKSHDTQQIKRGLEPSEKEDNMAVISNFISQISHATKIPDAKINFVTEYLNEYMIREKITLINHLNESQANQLKHIIETMLKKPNLDFNPEPVLDNWKRTLHIAAAGQGDHIKLHANQKPDMTAELLKGALNKNTLGSDRDAYLCLKEYITSPKDINSFGVFILPTSSLNERQSAETKYIFQKQLEEAFNKINGLKCEGAFKLLTLINAGESHFLVSEVLLRKQDKSTTIAYAKLWDPLAADPERSQEDNPNLSEFTKTIKNFPHLSVITESGENVPLTDTIMYDFAAVQTDSVNCMAHCIQCMLSIKNPEHPIVDADTTENLRLEVAKQIATNHLSLKNSHLELKTNGSIEATLRTEEEKKSNLELEGIPQADPAIVNKKLMKLTKHPEVENKPHSTMDELEDEQEDELEIVSKDTEEQKKNKDEIKIVELDDEPKVDVSDDDKGDDEIEVVAHHQEADKKSDLSLENKNALNAKTEAKEKIKENLTEAEQKAVDEIVTILQDISTKKSDEPLTEAARKKQEENKQKQIEFDETLAHVLDQTFKQNNKNVTTAGDNQLFEQAKNYSLKLFAKNKTNPAPENSRNKTNPTPKKG